MSDTIFALSSGPLPAGVAVLRISGPRCRAACEALCGALPHPRQASLRALRDPSTAELIDQGLVLWFPAPRSFTGEDVLELHVHGSRAVVAKVARVLGDMPGLRMAEAGEFTRRAFLNGRMDLTEAEGLADLLAAQTEAQHRQAIRQAGGALSRATAGWRAELIDLMAMVAATLDFADEGDVGSFATEDMVLRAQALARGLETAVSRSRGAEIIREGATVVLAGPPNAGKSSLLNALARRDVALVSPYAGTTRDVVEVMLDLRGLPIVCVDTAGLRDTDDPVEQMGIARTRARAAQADLVLWLSPDGDEPPREMVNSIRVRTKTDLGCCDGCADVSVSVVTGEGLEELLEQVYQRVASMVSSQEPAVVTQERQRVLLERAAKDLRAIGDWLEPELIAEHLRAAAASLDALVGRIDVEDVFDAVFGRFCIGK